MRTNISMKGFGIFILSCLLLTNRAFGQEFNKSVNKDSLVKTIIKALPENSRKEFLAQYNSGNDQSKEFLLFMYSMPRSSKKDLIGNIDINYAKINALKNRYSVLVPRNCTASIEYNPTNPLLVSPETIDLKITLLKNRETTVIQDWGLTADSDKLKKMLSILKWNNRTLQIIKKLLVDAHCVSIENGQITTIGFARSGLGKYSYLLFSSNLTNNQIKRYNDGCGFIFYKKNIVLQYEGGATGPQCFPD